MVVEGMKVGREQETGETHMVYLALYIKQYIEWIKTFQQFFLKLLAKLHALRLSGFLFVVFYISLCMSCTLGLSFVTGDCFFCLLYVYI